MSAITGKEAMFANVNITQDEIDLINRSPALVDQFLKYNNDVLKEEVRPIQWNWDFKIWLIQCTRRYFSPRACLRRHLTF